MTFNSFDLFDTLIFRYCNENTKLFKYLGNDEFYNVRVSLTGTFDEIYKKLQFHYGWSDEVREKNMKLELDEEWRQIFPIHKVVAKVLPEDIIVSDMYLPYSFIKKIVREKCKLKNKIFLSINGKQKGIIWDDIKMKMGRYPTQHTGDDIVSDIQIPKNFGIKTVQENIAHEEYCNLNTRACCLMNVFDGYCGFIFEITAQITINYIKKCTDILDKLYPTQEFVFTIRDCCYMYYAMCRMYPNRKSYLLQSSRKILRGPPDSQYDAYFDSIVNKNSVILDGNGTGISYKKYVKQREIHKNSYVFLNELMKDHITFLKPDILEVLMSVPFGSFIGQNKLATLEYPRVVGMVIETCIKCFLSLPYFDESFFDLDLIPKLDWFYSTIHQIEHTFIDEDPKEFEYFLNFMQHTNPISQIQLPPVYILSNNKSRIQHMHKLLQHFPFKNINIIEPEKQLGSTEKMTASQISHLKSYMNILQNNDNACYILEDDILSINNFHDTLMLLDYSVQYPDSMVYLEYCLADKYICNYPNMLHKKISSHSTFYCTASIAFSSKKVRSKLLKSMQKAYRQNIELPTDGLISHILKEKFIEDFRIYLSYPCFYQSFKDFGSTIEGSDDRQKEICYGHVWNEFNLTEKVKSLKKKKHNIVYKIFLLIIFISILLFFFIFILFNLKK